MGLISWVYKKFLQFTKKKKITNRYKIWTDISCKTSQCQGKMSNIISHQRNANKTTVRYHFMPKRMARKHTYIHTYTHIHRYTHTCEDSEMSRWACVPTWPFQHVSPDPTSWAPMGWDNCVPPTIRWNGKAEEGSKGFLKIRDVGCGRRLATLR